MSATKREMKRNVKCPRCCPDDAFGIFYAAYGYVSTSVDRAQDRDAEDAKVVAVWECSNCAYRKPRRGRALPPPDYRSPSQDLWLARIAHDFGGTLEVKRVGRSIWISAKNTARHWLADGQYLYGTIGDNGRLDLTLSIPGGTAKITNPIRFDIHVPVRRASVSS